MGRHWDLGSPLLVSPRPCPDPSRGSTQATARGRGRDHTHSGEQTWVTTQHMKLPHLPQD